MTTISRDHRSSAALSLVALAVALPAVALTPSIGSAQTGQAAGAARAVVGSSLPAGAELRPGDSLSSPSGRYELQMRPDGDLVLVERGNVFDPQPDESSVALGTPGSRLAVQADGNLVLYGTDGTPQWASGTAGRTAEVLVLQDDGNLVLYGPGGSVVYSLLQGPRSRLAEGGTLLPGDRLEDRGSGTTLVMQADGNLVLYAGGRAVFATGTRVPGSGLVLQEDGNVVVYSPDRRPQWASGSRRTVGSATLFVRDRELRLEAYFALSDLVLWSSAWGSSTVEPGMALAQGDRRSAPGVQLVMQEDGNLVQYVQGRPRFSTRTSGPGFALMQLDGNFVVYRDDPAADAPVAVFATRTSGAGNRLVVQADGNLVVYSPAGRALWASLR